MQFEQASTGEPDNNSDLDSTLLRGLSSYEHQASSNDQFESLLQAAATALPIPRESFRATSPFRDDQTFSFISSSRRRREAVDPDQLAIEHEIWGVGEENVAFDGMDCESNHPSNLNTEVHSAAALFRAPSQISRKYSRAPMSKLFTSLQVTPEQFLHLQQAAKSYMLDKRHPERMNSVGVKRGVEGESAKLKLFAFAKAFLEDEGWGEKCFGENSDGAKSAFRKLKWPQMRIKIIDAITPLLRRTVTNERQRQYAKEVRAEEAVKRQREQGSIRRSRSSADPSTNGDQYNFKFDEPFSYEINIMEDGRRFKPKFNLTPFSCSGFDELTEHVYMLMNDDTRAISSTKVLGPNGLEEASNEEDWEAIITGIKETVWMDGPIKCVVDIKMKE